MNLYTPKREKTVESYLLTRCRDVGLLCLKFVSPARRGVPDRIIIGPECTAFVELKRPGETVRRDQREMHLKMRRHGAQVHVIDDETDVDALVTQLRHQNPSTSEKSVLTSDRLDSPAERGGFATPPKTP